MNNKDISILTKHLNSFAETGHAFDKLVLCLNNAKKEINAMGNTGCATNKNVEHVIKYLNKATGKKYRHTTPKTRSLVKARINEGYTFKDFTQVIDIKTSDWLGTPQELFLRPETIFSNKFDGYLNQEQSTRKKESDKYPIPYDRCYVNKLDPQKNLEYEKFLISEGYKKSHGQGGTNFTKQ